MGAISTLFKLDASGAQSTLRSVTTHLTNIDNLVTKIAAKPLTINSEGAERLVGIMTSHLGVMQSVTQNMTTLSATMTENMSRQVESAQRVATVESQAVKQAQAKAAVVEQAAVAETVAAEATMAENVATTKTVSARQRVLALVNSQRGSLTRVLSTERKITAEVDKQKDKGMSITRGLIRAWATLSGIRGIWLATNKLLNIFNDSMLMTNKAATALRNTIGTMGSTGLDAGRVALDKYYEAANRARTSYTEFASTASKFMIVAPNAFGSDTKAIKFTETLSKSLQLAGATGEEVNSVLLQISQGLSSGYLQGEELRALRENGGMAAIVLADYLGTTVGGLKELGAQGKITADVLVAALAAAEKDIDASFNNLPKTISQQMAIAGNYIRKTLEPLARKIQEWLNSDQFEKFANASRKAWDVITAGLHAIVELALNVVIPAFNKIVDTLYWAATSSSTPATLLRLALIGIAAAATLVGVRFIWMKVQAIAGTLAAMWPLVLVGMVIAGLINILGRLTGRFTTFGDVASNTVYAVIYAIVALGLTAFNTIITIVAVILVVIRTVILVILAVVSAVLAFIIGLIMLIITGIIRFIGWLIDGLAIAAQGLHDFGNTLGEAITAGVNTAIRALNWLIEKLNSIPGLDLNWNTLQEKSFEASKESSASKSLRSAADKVSGFADNFHDLNESVVSGIMSVPEAVAGKDGLLGFTYDFADWVTEHNENNRPLDKADEIASGLTNKLQGWMSGIGDASNEEFLFDPYTGDAGSDAGGAGGSGGSGGSGTTDKIAQDTNDIKNLLERMRDLAERSAIAKFTNVNVNLDMTNNVGETDLDGVITYVNDKVAGAMNNSLAGVL